MEKDVKKGNGPHACTVVVELCNESETSLQTRTAGKLTTTVIRRAEYGDKGTVIPKLITILYDHMSATYQVHIISNEELVDDSFSEAVTDSSLIVFPIEGCV